MMPRMMLANSSNRLSKVSYMLLPTTKIPVPPAAMRAAVTALKIVYQRSPNSNTPIMAATAMRAAMPRDVDLAGAGCSLT